MQILLPGKLHSFEKYFILKSEHTFDERLELYITHCQWHPSEHSPTAKPRLQVLLHLIRGQPRELQVRAPTTGLLSGLNVLMFSLPIVFCGEYAKKDHHIHSLLLNSYHGHLVSTWWKIEFLIWSSRVRCMCSPISLSPFPLSLLKSQSSVRSLS